MTQPNTTKRFIQRGFSLVEVMVAMAIGLFGVMVMTQVYVTAEHNKNTSTSSGDAMTEGMVAIDLLQRSIRMAGYGISDGMLLGCNIVLRAGPPAVSLVAMAPVTINHSRIPAGDANTDTLLVFYASTNGTPQGDAITTQIDALQYSMRTISSFTLNDFVLVAPQVRNCPTVFAPPAVPVTVPLTLSQITALNNPTISITNNTGVVLAATVVPSTINTANAPTPAPSNHMVFNLGPNPPTILAYAIRNGNLTQCNYVTNDCSLTANTTNTAIWVPVASNIVSLRAQYGHYAAGAANTSITTYDQITPVTACQWIRTPAVRLAVVTRSTQRVENATSSVPVWEGASLVTTIPTSSSNPIILTGLPLASTDKWQNYRYKVHQSLITIRNIAWMGVVTGC